MKRSFTALAAVLIVIIISASAYGTYTLLNPSPSSSLPSAAPSPTPPHSDSPIASTSPTEQPTSSPSSTSTATPTPTSTSTSTTPTTTPVPTDPSSTNTPTPTTSATPIAPTPTPTSATQSPTPAPTPQNKTITITDATGAKVTINLPLKRIVCLNGGLTEILYALGGENKIVGLDDFSTSPPATSKKTRVGDSSAAPNMEMIFQLEPDLVIADTMLKAEHAEQFRNAGIPILIDTASNNSRIDEVVANLGTIVDAETTAKELIDWMNHYTNLVNERIANIPLSEKPTVYIEILSGMWRSGNTNSAYGSLIALAGGINIAPTNTSTTFPTLSPEYVVEQNPDIIIRMFSQNPPGTLTDLQAARDAIAGRPVLSETNAVKDGHVYAFNSKLISGLLRPIGLLYTAKCLHPNLFTDIDPTAIQTAMFQKYFGIPLDGAYTIPLNS